MPEERRPSIDERIEALTMNLELLLKQGQEQNKGIDRLREETDRHERDMQRFRRALRTALEAHMRNGDGENEA